MTKECPYCRGTGVAPIGKAYQKTLVALRRLRSASGAELGRILGITGEAACNRLSRMYSLGLVEPVVARDNRERRWKAV